MAAAGLPQATSSGEGMVGIAVGTWRSEAAFAVGASKVYSNGTAFRAGASFDSRGSGGFNAGIGIRF
jgi:autotransporter adhesin